MKIKNENEKMIELNKIDSVPKTGTLKKSSVPKKLGQLCSQNRNTSVPKMGTHNTYYNT